jgi:hypothetical protein
MARAHRWVLTALTTASLVAALSGCTAPPPLPTPVPAPLRAFVMENPAHCMTADARVPAQLPVILRTSGQAPEYVSINENIRFPVDLTVVVDTDLRWAATLW